MFTIFNIRYHRGDDVKRPFLLLLILLIVNIFFMLNFSLMITLIVTTMLSIILLVVIDYKVIVVSMVALILSFFVMYSVNSEVNAYEDQVVISGKVLEYGINSEDSFVLKSDYIIIDSSKEKFKHKVLIKFNDDYSKLIGKNIIIKTRLNLPFQNTNPNLFNYRNYLRSLGIDYTANLSQKNILSIGNERYTLEKGIHSFRKILSKHFEKVYSKESLAFIKGFIYGDKSEFTRDELDAFYNVGLGHILVVSGLHFGIMFLILQWLLTKFKVKQIHKFIIINCILFLFLAITGFKISSIRAFLMIILLESVYFIDRRLDLLNFLSFLSIIIILVNPLSIYSVSFLLSFGAIFSISFFYNKIDRMLPSFISIVLSVQIIIGLINIHYFNQINFATLLINIPINLIIVILYAMILINIILHPIQILTFLITKVITLIFSIVEMLDHQGFLRIVLPSFSTDEIIFLLCLIFVLILTYEQKRIKNKYIIYVFLVGIIALLSLPILNQTLEIYFFDVKSADSIFMRTPSKNKILIDTGRNDSYNLIGDILLKNGVKNIDLLFLTHNHDDHTGGLKNLLENHKVEYLFVSKYSNINQQLLEFKEELKNTSIISLEKGDEITYDNIKFNVLNPSNENFDENNQSLVVDASYKKNKMLFTGDIEKQVEFELINQLNSHYDLLKVPHHGSKTSSSQIFLNQIQPEYSIIQVGKNSYGHPDHSVINRYKNINTKILRNDLMGCIIFRINNKIEFETIITE